VNKQKLKDVPTPRESTTGARLPLPADRLPAVSWPTSTINLYYFKQASLSTELEHWCMHMK